MNRFFEFSPAQLRVVIALGGLLLFLSAYRFVRSFSNVENRTLKFNVSIGDGNADYSPIFTVDINHSPIDSLELIPGIGPTLAKRIIAYRDSVGRFESPVDITKVYGIGPKLYEKIKPYIKVQPW
jgi:competence protein ComEA